MAGYFGTEAQRRLQARAEASVDFISATPGACQAGRFMGCDDPEALGWERIDGFLERDGVCGFRLIGVAKADEVRSRLSGRNCRFDTWDVFLADSSSALAAAQDVLARGLPQGLTEMDTPADAESDQIARIQTLMAAAGMVPFSGSLLAGTLGPATTVALGDADGTVVAAAHGYMPHNTYSDFRGHAWGGLVAVAEAWRGKGLGNYINARMLVGVCRDLGATHVYELVSTSNIPSRRMIEACGLRHEPNLVCGIATPNDAARFTR